ncbi:shikimate kinase [Parabacteroides sp. PF5-9]|uniref:shikimate kinase n=1 Tax=Parabacteroides sp. PF5-9 TaxID=1742404 RepID=UPI0024753196|nr:shikimate kinase [Parabacteroides sp. PF5-9]MDH6356428.1 shikimate kinase [Parabacteroides sp. PF5-9]
MTRIFLVGYMGAGKTTVGKDLAKRMGLAFVDLDAYIESRYHKTVSQIFEEKGEGGFREIEQKMLHEVALFEDVIISTGGGAPCFYENMTFMNAQGTTIYLKASVDELAKRLAISKHSRPILKNLSKAELHAFIATNLEKREPFYQQATIIFDAEVMLTETDIQSISEQIIQIIHTDHH